MANMNEPEDSEILNSENNINDFELESLNFSSLMRELKEKEEEESSFSSQQEDYYGPSENSYHYW